MRGLVERTKRAAAAWPSANPYQRSIEALRSLRGKRRLLQGLFIVAICYLLVDGAFVLAQFLPPAETVENGDFSDGCSSWMINVINPVECTLGFARATWDPAFPPTSLKNHVITPLGTTSARLVFRAKSSNLARASVYFNGSWRSSCAINVGRQDWDWYSCEIPADLLGGRYLFEMRFASVPYITAIDTDDYHVQFENPGSPTPSPTLTVTASSTPTATPGPGGLALGCDDWKFSDPNALGDYIEGAIAAGNIVDGLPFSQCELRVPGANLAAIHVGVGVAGGGGASADFNDMVAFTTSPFSESAAYPKFYIREQSYTPGEMWRDATCQNCYIEAGLLLMDESFYSCGSAQVGQDNEVLCDGPLVGVVPGGAQANLMLRARGLGPGGYRVSVEWVPLPLPVSECSYAPRGTMVQRLQNGCFSDGLTAWTSVANFAVQSEELVRAAGAPLSVIQQSFTAQEAGTYVLQWDFKYDRLEANTSCGACSMKFFLYDTVAATWVQVVAYTSSFGVFVTANDNVWQRDFDVPTGSLVAGREYIYKLEAAGASAMYFDNMRVWQPAPAASPTPTALPTVTFTPSPTLTPIPTRTPQGSATPVASSTVALATATLLPTYTPYASYTPAPTWTPGATYTPGPTETPEATWTAFPTWTPAPTGTPAIEPTPQAPGGLDFGPITERLGTLDDLALGRWPMKLIPEAFNEAGLLYLQDEAAVQNGSSLMAAPIPNNPGGLPGIPLLGGASYQLTIDTTPFHDPFYSWSQWICRFVAIMYVFSFPRYIAGINTPSGEGE